MTAAVAALAGCAGRIVPAAPLSLSHGCGHQYQGAFLSGFVGDSGKGYESKVDYKVDPGKRPTAVSVTGVVTKRPGEYPFRMALFAEVPGHSDPHQFQQILNVRVVSPTSTTE